VNYDEIDGDRLR